jgi:hypothetical protein
MAQKQLDNVDRRVFLTMQRPGKDAIRLKILSTVTPTGYRIGIIDEYYGERSAEQTPDISIWENDTIANAIVGAYEKSLDRR